MRHMWAKGQQYLKKMGGIILVASLIIWMLSYFPRPTEEQEATARTEMIQDGNTNADSGKRNKSGDHREFVSRTPRQTGAANV